MLPLAWPCAWCVGGGQGDVCAIQASFTPLFLMQMRSKVFPDHPPHKITVRIQNVQPISPLRLLKSNCISASLACVLCFGCACAVCMLYAVMYVCACVRVWPTLRQVCVHSRQCHSRQLRAAACHQDELHLCKVPRDPGGRVRALPCPRRCVCMGAVRWRVFVCLRKTESWVERQSVCGCVTCPQLSGREI